MRTNAPSARLSNLPLSALMAGVLVVTSTIATGAVAQEAPPEEPPPAVPATPATAGDPSTLETPPNVPTSPDDAAAAPPPAGTPVGAAATTATISVSSNPAGRVYLDGVDTGLDTPVANLEVTPGEHTLKVVELTTGREKEIAFELEAGNALNLNVNLPEIKKEEPPKADPVKEAAAAEKAKADAEAEEAAAAKKKAEEDIAKVAAAPANDWTWMTVAGWSGLGLGALGLATGAVVLTTPGDPDQAPLGFALFGGGAGLVLGGGVLLYLDSELNGEGGLFNSGDDTVDGEAKEEKAAALPSQNTVALVE